MFGIALDVDDDLGELGGDGVEEQGYFCGEGEVEGVLAVAGEDGGLEVIELFRIDSLLGGLCVVAAEGHQGLVLVLVEFLPLEGFH